MKILMVTQDYFPARGGIQSYCHQVALNLSLLGHELTMICPGQNNASDKELPFKVIRIKASSSFLFLKLFGFLKKHITSQDQPYDHVLLAQWPNAIPFLFGQKAKGPKYHSMVHGRELLTGVFGPLTPWLCAKAYKKLDSVVPNSYPIADIFKRTVANFKNINVIHPGVDPERFCPQPHSKLKSELNLEDKLIISSVTRLVARKNIALIVEAMPLILKEIPNAHVVIGGIGPEFENIKSTLSKMKLEEHVSLIGSVPEEKLVEYFALGNVFVLPSSESSKDVEGFGIVFLEAGACEVPVIGANTGGIRDAVIHNTTGVLLEKITRENLATQIIAILKHPDKAKEMGVKSRERIIAELSWKKCGQNYIDKVFV